MSQLYTDIETEEPTERKKLDVEQPQQRYLYAAITIIDHAEPVTQSFWTKEEAERAQIEFWNQAYNLGLETTEDLNDAEMNAGDFWWIKVILLPETND